MNASRIVSKAYHDAAGMISPLEWVDARPYRRCISFITLKELYGKLARGGGSYYEKNKEALKVLNLPRSRHLPYRLKQIDIYLLAAQVHTRLGGFAAARQALASAQELLEQEGPREYAAGWKRLHALRSAYSEDSVASAE